MFDIFELVLDIFVNVFHWILAQARTRAGPGPKLARAQAGPKQGPGPYNSMKLSGGLIDS